MGEDRTAVVGEAGLPTAARTETVLLPIILPAAIPTGTDTGRRLRTDRREGIRIRRHRNKALVGMDGTEGRRSPRRRTMVGPRDLRADHTVGVLEVVMGRLVILRRTDGEGMVVMAVKGVVMVVKGVVVQGVTVVTVPPTGTVAVGTVVAVAAAAHIMVPREAEGAVVGDVVIYALYILIDKFADCDGVATESYTRAPRGLSES